MSILTGRLFGDAAVEVIFADRYRLEAMLRFEAALAQVQAEAGLIPSQAAPAIAAACDPDLYDIGQLAEATRLAGNPAIPLVKALTAQVQAAAPEAARFVHWGATSQDVIDTGLVLQIVAADAVMAPVRARITAALTTLTETHRDTLMAGRTLLQHALPTTFGLKCAGWLDSIRYVDRRLTDAVNAAARLQFGGAAGTLGALDDAGLRISAALAQALGLPEAALPWHARRERIADLGAALALYIGVLGKIGRDIALMMQTEVGETFEPAAAGKGGSSAMPHKRNPVGAVVLVAAAARAPGLASTLLSVLPQEHERAVGGWHAEWEVLPELFRLAAGAAEHAAEILERLEIDTVRMRANLDLTQGLPLAEGVALALAPRLGRAEAHALVEAASKTAVTERRPLIAVLKALPDVAANLSDDDLTALFDPSRRLGVAHGFIDRVLKDD
ncbi:MAG: 3-carboxy-cis,cis-muconate cycloisomerase [Brevundimonas sp.]